MKIYTGKNCEQRLFFKAVLLGTAALLLLGCAVAERSPEESDASPAVKTIAVTNLPSADPKTVVIPSNAFHKAFTQKDLNDWLSMSLYVMMAAEGSYVEQRICQIVIRIQRNLQLTGFADVQRECRCVNRKTV